MNITLIGYRGSGKSTVARLVAERLGWDAVDADQVLEQRAGCSIREVFELEGEAGFRDREVAVLDELARRRCCVIAAGGGAVLRPENRAAMRRAGLTVWLVASPETVQRRIEADPTTAGRRPPLTTLVGIDEVRRLLADREPHYRACADVTIETDSCPPEQVADQIVQAFLAAQSSIQTE
jgi:shikimate kinase